MKDIKNCTHLKNATTSEIWREIGRRLNIEFGKVQMTFHNGQPTEYTNLDIRIPTDEIGMKEPS